MKHLKTKIMFAVITFVAGVSAAAIWWVNFTPDPNIYEVEFCDLIRESKKYNGKIIRIQAFYQQGFEATFLSNPDCTDFIMLTCSSNTDSCMKVFNSIRAEHDNSKKIRIDVIGKYIDSEFDSFENKNVHKFDIIEGKNVLSVDAPK